MLAEGLRRTCLEPRLISDGQPSEVPDLLRLLGTANKSAQTHGGRPLAAPIWEQARSASEHRSSDAFGHTLECRRHVGSVVSLVAREQFVAAVTCESDGYGFPCHLGEAVGRHGRRVRILLPVVPDQQWERDEHVGADDEFVMLCVVATSDAAGV